MGNQLRAAVTSGSPSADTAQIDPLSVDVPYGSIKNATPVPTYKNLVEMLDAAANSPHGPQPKWFWLDDSGRESLSCTLASFRFAPYCKPGYKFKFSIFCIGSVEFLLCPFKLGLFGGVAHCTRVHSPFRV